MRGRTLWVDDVDKLSAIENKSYVCSTSEFEVLQTNFSNSLRFRSGARGCNACGAGKMKHAETCVFSSGSSSTPRAFSLEVRPRAEPEQPRRGDEEIDPRDPAAGVRRALAV